MPARMCYRNIVLCVALAFWVACNNDSSSNTAVEISAPDEVSSSTEVVTEISSSSKIHEDSSSSVNSSSSKNQESSSSSVASSSSKSLTDVSSSSEAHPYTLWLHPSVHCKNSQYYSQASCSSFRPEPQMDKPNSQASPPLPGMGPITCWEYPVNTFACDNGMVYPNNREFSLSGDTIIQCSMRNFNVVCVPAEEDCAKMIADAEASTENPHVLANDSTVLCKQMYEMKLDTGCNAASHALGSSYAISVPTCEGYYEWQNCSSYYLCEDGNRYDYKDMLKDENGNIYKRKKSEE
ncbi:hypothetical protein [uncultured Fibrobacter sp.]|uniref:hypothetical protein n=1 Tax=uncultured Fibrobacter sp. TaxID=261512 RepID=UPI0025F01056|nr:hypothetical protein [uncultured Fibrobacter sp.]